MKHTVYAVLGAALSMLVTTGALVLATAAPAPSEQRVAEAELVDELDTRVAAQLIAVKTRLAIATSTPSP